MRIDRRPVDPIFSIGSHPSPQLANRLNPVPNPAPDLPNKIKPTLPENPFPNAAHPLILLPADRLPDP